MTSFLNRATAADAGTMIHKEHRLSGPSCDSGHFRIMSKWRRFINEKKAINAAKNK